MKRKGQAFIIVVIIFALIVSIFAISISTAMRSQALEETEIYQREQALYLAQMGINQMIYNINNGTTYTNGQNITGTSSGIGTYKATYYTPDTSGYGGIATIKGEGTVGQFTRIIYASLQGGGSTEAFKYCLFTAEGNYTKTNTNSESITFNNSIYAGYFYNTAPAVTPYPDWGWYTNVVNYPAGEFVQIDKNRNYSFSAGNATYSGKVVFINYTGSKANATLTINFNNLTSNPIVSIITNYPKVTFAVNQGSDITWRAVSTGSQFYPLFLHIPKVGTGSVNINLDYFATDCKTITFEGISYTSSPVTISYGGQYWGFLDIKGELISKSLTTDWDYLETSDLNGDGRITTKTIFDYTKNYFLYPPPHFIYTPSGAGVKFIPSSFREEY